MKFLGHPIHTMLVHFPTALLPMDVVLSYVGYKSHDSSFAYAAYYCMVGGVASGYLAMITGLVDLVGIKENKPALGGGLIHGFINGTAILIYTIFVYKQWKMPIISEAALSTIIIKAFVVLLLLIGNYFGGQLIFKHRVGVDTNKI